MLIIVVVIGIYFYFFRESVPLSSVSQINNQTSRQQVGTRRVCLNDNEIAEYKLEKIAMDNLAKITIKNRNTNNIIFESQINNIMSTYPQ